ncbi:hypothetical protein QUF61_15705 [Candidatus Venteria ishoeyi]|uniref:hypothetical protein n=1 Tax=Candidatus Venteria ishoeyi TaxID=1899563 RepID=UPI0025A4F8D4|nr:hypothetical protein [Candidatus Venteria ishoeyi]MDM8547933.1 hypothetical protein [Candidatus Venteria ishoeyi]
MALLSDWKQKNIKAFTHFYAPAIIVGIILLISYLYFCYLYWGDPLIRFHNIQSMTKTHLWSFESGNTQQLIDRLSIKPVILFYNTFGLLLVLTLLSLFKLPTQLKPWLYYLLFTIFFFWFGTTSFSDYQPIVPIERVILVCLPGFIILSAYFLSQLRIPVINSYQLLHQTIKIIILIIACLPFMIYISSWGIMHDASAESMSIVKQEANAYPDKQSLLITSDLRSKDSLKYFFGYKYPKNIHVISAEQLPELINKGLNYKKILIYIDNQLSMFLYRAYGNDFYDELIYKMEFNLIYKRNQVFLYDVIKEEKLIKLNNVIKEKYPDKHYIGIVNSTKNN